MTDAPPYICYPGTVKAEMCDRIIALGEKLQFGRAQVVDYDQGSYKGDTRKGRIAFFPHEPQYGFIYDGLSYFTDRANREKWNFELVGLLPLQYSIYSRGDFFNWHRDTLSAPQDPSRDGPPLVRKLSFSLQLSEPHDYVGGDFEVKSEEKYENREAWSRMRERGSFIIFPSATVHRVTPVVFGERRSLVGWVLGVASEEDMKHDKWGTGAEDRADSA